MSLHVIVGAGPVGSAVATQLAARGETVRLITRSGTGPEHAAITCVAADATDVDRLTELTDSAEVIYNCANPQYHRWLTDWPPLASTLLAAAERSGAVLATTSNLYGYGPVSAPITPDTPMRATHPKLRLRADMWRDALSRPIRTTEVRGGDYLERNSIFAIALAAPLLAGRRGWVPGALDAPHSWTSVADVATTLITVATEPRAWGQAWLVPSNPPMTIRELATRFTRVNHAPAPKLSRIPYPGLWAAGLFSPMLRELRTTNYQFARPFTLDASLTEETFGLTPGDLDEALRAAAQSAGTGLGAAGGRARGQE
jgi:nucleoside-diphosphate-sugar epimerase